VAIEADRILDGPTGDFYYQTIPYSLHDHKQTVVESGREITGDPSEFIMSRISERSLPGTQPTEEQYYSIGRSGQEIAFVAIKLSRPLDVTDKIRVIECSYGCPGNTEYADVYVSSDGETWKFIKTVCNTEEDPPVDDQHTSIIPIPDNVGTVNYIKFEDHSTTPGGYDIDYLGDVLLNEGNWNPGDTNYIAYQIDNTGSKAIKLRATVSGTWDDPALNANNPVTIGLAPDCVGWEPVSGMVNTFEYTPVIPGSHSGPPGSATLYLTVTLDGAGANNDYQGQTYRLTPTFQAVQASHSSNDDGADGWTWEAVFPSS
jgi:hypothetical protein